MKIEFTKEDLDYLAEKIAKIMMNRNLPTVNADKKFKDITMTVRLSNCIKAAGLEEYTLHELSQVRPSEWKKFRNLGPKAYAEFMQLFAEGGCTFGNRYLDYDRETHGYKIL